jgi:O-acetyl-ADP-ribose deacetylase (regulator of RNase III)
MPVSFAQGDLFAHPRLDALAHGCNCAGAMGKGIAVEFRARFPAMYEEYKRRCTDGRFRPGDVFEWVQGAMTIYNLGTQATWRTKAKLSDVETAMRRMIELAETRGVRRLGLPRIGAGLGGLEWATVREVIAKFGDVTKVELIVFESFDPRGSSGG